jgi:hypothetical protein
MILFALVASETVFRRLPGSSDRAQAPRHGASWQVDDGAETTLPVCALAPPSERQLTRCLFVTERTPATSAFTSRIFRPPISALA